MHTLLMQDWVTLKAASPTLAIVQSVADWLDVSSYQDVVFWSHVTSTTGAQPIALTYQTSPTEDDAFFQSTGVTVDLSTSTPVVISPVLFIYGDNVGVYVPISRYLRWRITSAAAWTATFRIYVSANPPRG
jgi:hypothetical protein